MLKVDILCPECRTLIHVPFFRKLKAQAIEDFDMLELSALEKLESQTSWLRHASLWQLLQFWVKRRLHR